MEELMCSDVCLSEIGSSSSISSEGGVSVFSEAERRLVDLLQSKKIKLRLKAKLREELLLRLRSYLIPENRKRDVRGGSSSEAVLETLVVDFLRCRGKTCSLSVVIPDFGYDSSDVLLSRNDILAALGLTCEPGVVESFVRSFQNGGGKKKSSMMEDLLRALLNRGEGQFQFVGDSNEGDKNCSTNAMRRRRYFGISVQTQTMMNASSPCVRDVDLQLAKIDQDCHSDYVTAHNSEDRMLRFQRDCQQRCDREIAGEADRIRRFEIGQVRLEEGRKAREELERYRKEFETLHRERVNRLEIKERKAVERLQQKEREVEERAHQARQEIVRQLDEIRLKKESSERAVLMERESVKSLHAGLEAREHRLAEKEDTFRSEKGKRELDLQAQMKSYEREVEGRLSEDRLRLQRAEIEVERGRSLVQQEREFVDSFKTQLQNIKSESERNKTLANSLETKNGSLHHEVEDLRDQLKLSAKTLDREKQSAKSIDADMSILQKEHHMALDRFRESKEGHNRQLEDSNAKLRALQERFEDCRTTLAACQNELNRVRQEEIIKGPVVDVGTHSRLKEEMQTLQLEKERLISSLRESSLHQQHLQEEHIKSTRRHNEHVTQLTSELGDVRSQLQLQNNNVSRRSVSPPDIAVRSLQEKLRDVLLSSENVEEIKTETPLMAAVTNPPLAQLQPSGAVQHLAEESEQLSKSVEAFLNTRGVDEVNDFSAKLDEVVMVNGQQLVNGQGQMILPTPGGGGGFVVNSAPAIHIHHPSSLDVGRHDWNVLEQQQDGRKYYDDVITDRPSTGRGLLRNSYGNIAQPPLLVEERRQRKSCFSSFSGPENSNKHCTNNNKSRRQQQEQFDKEEFHDEGVTTALHWKRKYQKEIRELEKKEERLEQRRKSESPPIRKTFKNNISSSSRVSASSSGSAQKEGDDVPSARSSSRSLHERLFDSVKRIEAKEEENFDLYEDLLSVSQQIPEIPQHHQEEQQVLPARKRNSPIRNKEAITPPMSSSTAKTINKKMNLTPVAHQPQRLSSEERFSVYAPSSPPSPPSPFDIGFTGGGLEAVKKDICSSPFIASPTKNVAASNHHPDEEATSPFVVNKNSSNPLYASGTRKSISSNDGNIDESPNHKLPWPHSSSSKEQKKSSFSSASSSKKSSSFSQKISSNVSSARVSNNSNPASAPSLLLLKKNRLSDDDLIENASLPSSSSSSLRRPTKKNPSVVAESPVYSTTFSAEELLNSSVAASSVRPSGTLEDSDEIEEEIEETYSEFSVGGGRENGTSEVESEVW